MKKEIWFKSKAFGWGWCPYTWQAWLIMALYITTIITSLIFLDSLNIPVEQKVLILTPELLILTIILIYISYKKGEKPVWRWGF